MKHPILDRLAPLGQFGALMAPETNAFTAYSAIGNREDLSDIIYNIAPTDTPFLSGIPTTTASAVLHEWQTDTLAAANADNKYEEGEAGSADAATATVRRNNRTQISRKQPRVSGTQEVVQKAGRGSEMAYQITKRAQELKRDIESRLLCNQAKVTGASGTDPESAGILSWIATNESTAGTAPTGDGTDTRTGGALRAFTESLLKTTLAAVWASGGDPDCIMVNGFNKQAMSAFTGNATRFKGAGDKTLVAAIDKLAA